MDRERISYFFIRTFAAPFSILPYSWLHCIGRLIGRLAYYCMREYRKRALSNLALANDLPIQSEKELIRIAKKSFENLAINVLEYARFDREKDFSKVIRCENPETANAIHRQGQGVIFFCGHLSNWEALFLDGTKRMKGIAIGKAIKNKVLYRWIVSIREKHGGTIIAPRNAIKEGLRALRKGTFLGIVGDQGMPDSGYSFPFLGRRAWSTTAPALLAYKTHCPIIVATTRRIKGGYRIRYSDPIWPNLEQPLETETVRLMNALLTILQESIKSSPGEWLWQHNRWKQQTPQILYKRFRKDCICIILPENQADFDRIRPHLATLKQIYPQNFLFLLVPERYQDESLIPVDEVIYYRDERGAMLRDYRFKLIFNFSPIRVARHYEKLSVFEVLNIEDLQALAAPHLSQDRMSDWSEVFKRALCRPGTI
ncbi:MAG: htrB [Parachlamydiales bacterium]|nr:htrB [Parachlamydiales bacterium]